DRATRTRLPAFVERRMAMRKSAVSVHSIAVAADPSPLTTTVQSPESAAMTQQECSAQRTGPNTPRTAAQGPGWRWPRAFSPPAPPVSAEAIQQSISAPRSENSEIETHQCDPSGSGSKDSG